MNAPTSNPETIGFAENELAGTLLATCVNQLEGLKTPWSMTSETNQQIHINKMRENIENAVKKAVLTISTQRRSAIRATVDSVTIKDGVKATMILDKHNASWHDLGDAQGSTVLIIITDAEAFMGGAEKVTPAPDQAALDLAGGEDATKGADGLPESIPEIKENADGTFTVYKDQMPMPGGKGFGSHADAETWLQKALGVEKKPTPAAGGEPVVPVRDEATEQKKIDDATVAFKAAGAAEGKKEVADWDKGWAEICDKYDPAFVDDNYDVLSAAYADGFESTRE